MKLLKKNAWTVLAAPCLAVAMTTMAEARDLTVVAWGGPPQALQHEIYYKPFAEQTGIPLTEDSWSGGYGILKAKVDNNQLNWDVIQVESDEEALGCADGIYEPLDWSVIGDPATFYPGMATDCGVGANVYAFVLAYDSAKTTEAPSDWSALWDTATWPGKRAVRKGAKGTLEIALLADGVPISEVYEVLATPEGVERAFAKLDEIKGDIIWWESTAQIMQLLNSGEVALAVANDAPISRVRLQEDSSLRIVWNDSLRASDYWVVLKGTPFPKEAMQLVGFISQPEQLAQYAQQLPVGVPSKSAMALVPENIADLLLSAPANYDQSAPIDKDFWMDNGEELTLRFNAWLAQ